MDERQNSLIWIDFICEKCGKPIKGHKHMKIGNKHYHMTCGMALAFNKDEVRCK